MNLLFISLGCDKNLVDSEHMLGDIADAGFTICDDEAIADVIVINTCSFIADAMEESISTIIDMGRYKQEGCLKALIVTGCLAQRFSKDFFEELPEVDAILGTNSYDELIPTINMILNKNESHVSVIKELTGLPHNGRRYLSTGGHYAFLKIAEGCSKRCTYCVIPYIRGNYRSVPMEQLLEEAKELATNGVKELILVAQETTVYGLDLYNEKKLPELLDKLSEIDGIEWIRLLYAYPEEITDKLIDCMASNKKVVHYIDMPIQHCNDQLLKAMGRKTNKKDIIDIISRLRSSMPDITIRTTLIAGFPGETANQHDEMMDFIRLVRFDRLGVFPYSCEEGTVACNLPNQVDDGIKLQWADEVMSLQSKLSSEINKTFYGKVLRVFIEGEIPEDGVFVGRTYRDVPGVDGLVFVNSSYNLSSGQFVNVRISGSLEYDLIGDVVDEFTE